MIFKSIYISAFGALKNYTLDFSEGLQVIYGENEAGKTTITEFIKSMFYGTGRRAAGQVMSVREKYTPLDGSPAGGRVYFEHSGKEFCLERIFRKSDATDKITLTETASGKSEAVPSDIGKSLFGITMPAFERSVFIGNTPDFSFDEGAAGEINQKLTDTALTGEDGVSYGKILNRLDDARLKLISKSGKTGSLVADINRCNELIEQLGAADAAARKKQELNAGIEETQSRINEINKKAEKFQTLLEQERDIENAQKYKEYLECKERLDVLTKRLTLPDGTVADEMFLKKFEFAFSKLAKLKEKAEEDREELKNLKIAAEAREGSTPEEIRAKIEEEKEKFSKNENARSKAENSVLELKKQVEAAKEQTAAANRKKPVNIALLILGVICLLTGAGLYFAIHSLPLTIALCGAGALLFILSFIIRPRDKSALQNAQYNLTALQNELNAKQNELMMLGGEKNNIEAKIENLNISLNFGVNEEHKIKETEERIENAEAQIKEEEEKVKKFFGFSEDADLYKLRSDSEALYGLAEEQKQTKLHLSFLSRDLGEISYEEARERLASLEKQGNAADLTAAKEEIKKLAIQKTEAQTLKTQYETELKTGFRGIGDPEDLRREIAELKENIAAKQAFYDAASAAFDVLSESLVEARSSFGSALENKTLENFKNLTGGAYAGINISSDFDIRTEKSGDFGMHDIEYLSRGTKDQVYLALRLAVASLITEKEPLPVILDDSLSQYDDKRFSLALEFLKNYAKDTQIALFTCHNFVTDEAKRQNIKTVEL
ncbi:MAG: AAA family ATPase [Clostridia bacterium]|nr:AAA family ATPase [Clostridia bacterium]